MKTKEEIKNRIKLYEQEMEYAAIEGKYIMFTDYFSKIQVLEWVLKD